MKSVFANYRLRSFLAVLLCILILSACIYAAVVGFFVPYSQYRRACQNMESGAVSQAAEGFRALEDFLDSAQKLDACNLTLSGEALSEGDYPLAGSYFAALSDPDSAQADALRQRAYEQADALFARTLYEQAYACYSAFGFDAEAQECVETLYNSLTTDVEYVCGIPSGFTSEILRGYKDADKYALAYQLENASWETPQEKAENLRLIYEELGDFLDASAHGFAVQRLFGNTYSNSAGYYFEMDETGNFNYNLPCYRLPGYYGLYTKIIDGILYIGSDEKNSWTKQFRFTFSDYDETLTIYSYRAGTNYTLYLEH